MSFGQNLKKYRLAAKLTQTDLAKKLGIIQSNIHRWEADKITPTIETLKKIALILNTSSDDLLFSKKEKEKLTKNDKKFVTKLNELDLLDPEDKETIIKMIETCKIKASMKSKK